MFFSEKKENPLDQNLPFGYIVKTFSNEWMGY
jgi:hypothetical protein